jgi:hypothetical protein|nr:MAG TPA: large terminase [Caudoviricetes sp.]
MKRPANLDEARAIAAVMEASRRDPNFYVENVIGDSLWSKQQEVLRAIAKNRIVTVASCHGIGKTHLAARAAHQFLNTYKNSYVVTTAPTFRQVEELLWRQIRAVHKKSAMARSGRLLKTMLEYSDEWFAIGVSSDDTDKIQGFHPASGNILVIVDEAAGVSEETFVAVEAIMTSLGAHALFIGNPTKLSGTFYNSHHIDPKSCKIRISCFDTPNFTNNGIETIEDLKNLDEEALEIVAPYLITPQWAADKITRWGVDTPMFQSRVLGQFPTAEVNTLIPLEFIEAAMTPERLAELQAAQSKDEPLSVGVDVARFGDDKTVITRRKGSIVTNQHAYSKEDTEQTAGRVKMIYPAPEFIGIDEDGLGGGVVDKLTHDKIDGVVGILNNSSARKDDTGLTFVNLRSQLWWNLAERFKSGKIYIPPEFTELAAELSAIRYDITRQGIAVETKEQLKKRLHRSPDRADSLMYAFANFVRQAEVQRIAVARRRQK